MEQAAQRFRQAIEIDATFVPAYLALADLLESTGDLAEANRVLGLATEHAPGDREVIARRGVLLARSGAVQAATDLLVTAARARPGDLDLWSRVLETAPRAGAFPVALAAARRLRRAPSLSGPERQEAAAAGAALSLLVDTADPVAAGCAHGEAARRALCRVERSVIPGRR